MKPAVLIAVAVIAILGVAAIALATSGGGDDDGDAAQASPTPASTATAVPTNTAAATPTAAPSATSVPATATSTVEPASPTPVPAEPTATAPLPPAPTPSSLAGRHPEPAPIDELEVRIAESFPPQYFVYVLAGLPSGCAEPYTHTVARSGNDVVIEVLNSVPDGTPFCTAIYGQYELNIPLGSDFVSGQDYTVIVNGGEAEFVFTAQ